MQCTICNFKANSMLSLSFHISSLSFFLLLWLNISVECTPLEECHVLTTSYLLLRTPAASPGSPAARPQPSCGAPAGNVSSHPTSLNTHPPEGYSLWQIILPQKWELTAKPTLQQVLQTQVILHAKIIHFV